MHYSFYYTELIERIEDVQYILENFSIVKRKDEQQYGYYYTKELILTIYDEFNKCLKSRIEYNEEKLEVSIFKW